MLQWYTALVKYVDYTAEFGRVCECLQQMAKGNDEKILRFATVAKENQSHLDLVVLFKALLK